ncbi:MAG: hypothetical protein KUG75_03060 [Pseudomonadales bacterium]|nr:hypothetical protein [Pseudomonadales bacterium]
MNTYSKTLFILLCSMLLSFNKSWASSELICPCAFSSADPTSTLITAGIKNTGISDTGALRISAVVRATSNANTSGKVISEAYYSQTLPVSASFPASTAIESGFFAPPAEEYFVFLQLDEMVNNIWVFQDVVRMQPSQSLDTLGGASAGDSAVASNGALFFDGTPTISIAGDSITVNLPPIQNSSTTFSSGNLSLEVGIFESPEFFEQSRIIGALGELGYSLPPKTASSASSIVLDYLDPGSPGFEYIHLSIQDSSQNFPILLWQTVLAPSGTQIVNRNFSLTSVDTLTDTDLDGVSDFNEDLANTDSGNAADTPGLSNIDVLAFYTPGVVSIYGGEPEARIIQEIAFANQVLEDSGVNSRLNLVQTQQVSFSEAVFNQDAFDAMENQTGVFSDLASQRDSAGADLVVLFRPVILSDDNCGLGTLTGVGREGDFSAENRDNIISVVYAECRDTTLIHEFGHNMGLAHSVRGPAVTAGTFEWSRGHGVDSQFFTIMANITEYPGSSASLVFSNPNINCVGLPCGIENSNVNIAADAVLTLNTVRFQVAALTTNANDTDGDGVNNDIDAFPSDPNESADTDGDGTGNNADPDDDGDGMPDSFEIDNGLDTLNSADALLDADNDGATNLQEYQADTDPNDGNSVDACLLDGITAPLPSDSSLAIEKLVPVANPGSNTIQQTFLRFINPNMSSAAVEVYGIDDNGLRSKNPPLSFNLDAQASLQFNAQDLENGNSNKGISSKLCNGQGKWQLAVRSDQELQVQNLIRTPDGFLTSLNDTVPRAGNSNLAYFANPASNMNQQSFLRIVNLGGDSGTVSITGIDDSGTNSVGTITFSLNAYQSKQINAHELEAGSVSKGLTGSLGNGTGKWRLTTTSVLDLRAMSLIRTPDGFLTNLSGMVDENIDGDHVIYFGNPASETSKQTFLRIINASAQSGTVTISGIDDNGIIAPGGEVMFDLGAQQSKQINAADLESGNIGKGLVGMLGDGTGRWRLTVSADVDIQVMSLVRTPDGFLTNLSRTTPVSGNINTIHFFNPASNSNQISSLRIINDDSLQAELTISGIDDDGNAAPGGDILLNIPANSALEITAQDLENGNAQLGLVGALGNGTGKWQIKVSSSADLKVQGLMNTPSGFLTNLSRAIE